ncbi:MAG: transposase [Tagaea sp.]
MPGFAWVVPPKVPPRLSRIGWKTLLIEPGSPWENSYCEHFNGRLRAECLKASWFISMADARQRIEEWRTDYNNERPHMALGGLTPKAYADQIYRVQKFA